MKNKVHTFGPTAIGALSVAVRKFLARNLGSYRRKMAVAEMMLFPDQTAYAVCPRCHVTLEREYVDFCDRCGQHLAWENYAQAKLVYPDLYDPLHI